VRQGAEPFVSTTLCFGGAFETFGSPRDDLSSGPAEVEPGGGTRLVFRPKPLYEARAPRTVAFSATSPVTRPLAAFHVRYTQ